MEKNNLEKLYQEKLKDFREIPDETVWESIAASLDKKKKKRVLPIWWKLGGVAALLALLFYVVNPFESSISVNETTDIETPINKKSNDINSNQKLSNDTINKVDDANTIRIAEVEENKKDSVINEVQIATANSSKKENANTSGAPSNGIVTNNDVKNDTQNQKVKNKGRIAVTENQNLDKNDTQNVKNQIDFEKSLENSKTSEVTSSNTDGEKQKTISNQKEDLDKKLSNTKEAVADSRIDTKIDDEKKSIFDAIEEQKEEEIAIGESKENAWSVGPSIAPVYYDAVGQGSPIHSNFIENSKSGNINLSYGLTVAYNLGKRLKVRSGIHKVDYGYDTNEVVFSSSIAANSTGIIDNIDFSQSSRTIVVQSKKINENALASPSANDFSATQNPLRDGRMSQQLGYLEVPLELNYSVVDKKIGVNLIGGVSSLFLVDNSISLQSEGLVTEIGEANNVNAVNFSGNFGFGFSYEFSPKIQINLEPVFKYQLNTFSQTSGSFNPYSVGVYSGIRFSF